MDPSTPCQCCGERRLPERLTCPTCKRLCHACCMAAGPLGVCLECNKISTRERELLINGPPGAPVPLGLLGSFAEDEKRFPLSQGMKIGAPGEEHAREAIDEAIGAYLGPRHNLSTLKREAERFAGEQAAKARKKKKARQKGKEAKAARRRNRR